MVAFSMKNFIDAVSWLVKVFVIVSLVSRSESFNFSPFFEKKYEMSKHEILQFLIGIGCYVAVILKNSEEKSFSEKQEKLKFKFETFLTAQIQNWPRLISGDVNFQIIFDHLITVSE